MRIAAGLSRSLYARFMCVVPGPGFSTWKAASSVEADCQLAPVSVPAIDYHARPSAPAAGAPRTSPGRQTLACGRCASENASWGRWLNSVRILHSCGRCARARCARGARPSGSAVGSVHSGRPGLGARGAAQAAQPLQCSVHMHAQYKQVKAQLQWKRKRDMVCMCIIGASSRSSVCARVRVCAVASGGCEPDVHLGHLDGYARTQMANRGPSGRPIWTAVSAWSGCGSAGLV